MLAHPFFVLESGCNGASYERGGPSVGAGCTVTAGAVWINDTRNPGGA